MSNATKSRRAVRLERGVTSGLLTAIAFKREIHAVPPDPSLNLSSNGGPGAPTVASGGLEPQASQKRRPYAPGRNTHCRETGVPGDYTSDHKAVPRGLG